MQLKKGDQKLDIDEEWLPLRDKMQDALVGEMHDAHIAVAWLALSCGRWAKSNATGMKLSHTAVSMFGELMFIPKIFDAPIILSNVDIAGISRCNANTVPVALKQLEALGLVQTQQSGQKRSITLAVPAKELTDAHEDWLKNFTTMDNIACPHMPFRVALPKWKKFTARFTWPC